MNLIKKHIKKNPLSLKKLLFIGLLSLIFNSNLYAQLDAPSSSWNTLIQSEVYGEVFDSEELFVNVEKPVFINQYDNASYRLDKLTNEGDNLGNIFEEVSYTFSDGYFGTQKNNPHQVQDILTFSTLGINSVVIYQNSENDQFGGTQGNDTAVSVIVNFNSGSSQTFNSSINFKENSGPTLDIIGIIFEDSVNYTFSYNNGNNSFTIVGGNSRNTSTSLGLKVPDSSESLSDDEDRNGNASSSDPINWLNNNIDATVPVITLIGSDVSQEVGGSYTDAGATASDNIDGDITSNIAVVNPVDPNSVGVYTITYNVSDTALNPATQVTRTVTITADATIPVITLVGDNPQSIELGTAYSELGATATDNIDADITENIVIDATAVNVNAVGDYTVTYNVADAAGNNATQVTRTVTITADATIPVITLVGANPQSIELGTAYSELGATAEDNIDGTITSSIVIDATAVNVNAIGDYTVTYNVADAATNNATQVTRTVTITADQTIPVITLVGANPQSIELGTAYSELGATAEDNIDGTITSSIVIDATAVNVNAVGDYTVTYNVSDAAGNDATQVTRTVTITADATIPVITLAGANPQSIE